MEAHLNTFDYVVLGVMALSCLFAFFRGLVREVLSLIAWVGAGVITMVYFHGVAEKLTPHFKNPMVAASIATIGLYLGSLICFGIINMIIVKSIKSGEEAGMLDNLLGLIFGGLRGALIVSLGFFLLTVALPGKEYPEWIEKAVTRPYAEKGALMLAAAAPKYLRELSAVQKKATEEIKARREQSNESPAAGGQEENGYSRTTTRQLDRLIDSTGNSQ